MYFEVFETLTNLLKLFFFPSFNDKRWYLLDYCALGPGFRKTVDFYKKFSCILPKYSHSFEI